MSKLMQMVLGRRFRNADVEDTGGGFADDDEFIKHLMAGDDDIPEPIGEDVPKPTEEPLVTEPAAEDPAPVQEPAPAPEPEQTAPVPEKAPEPVKPVEDPAPVPQPTAEELQAQHQNYLAAVEKEFAISEEDANLLLSEPEKVLPKIGARMHDYTMRAVSQLLQQSLPQVMEGVLKSREVSQTQEQRFKQLNPFLEGVDQTELETLVNELAPVVAKTSKGLDGDARMKKLGNLIAAHMGIAVTAPKQQEQQPAAKPPVPKPFTPASPARNSNMGAPAPATADEAFIADLLKFQDDY